TSKYAKFSKAAGLPTKAERMRISKYHRVKTLDELQKRSVSGIIKKQGGNIMKIDKFTPCLENVKTGTFVDTAYRIAQKSELSKLEGWNFHWFGADLEKATVYELTTIDSDIIQGLVAIEDYSRDKAVYVHIAESAPHNLGKNKEFYGVGGHLFAIAAQCSKDLGYGGFVFMDAKNKELVEHYHKTMGAQLLGMPHPYRMFIDERAAEKLLKVYTLKGE
ncbi:MAG: hypothetical protein RRY24_04685, partial [Clostridiales bacterium]